MEAREPRDVALRIPSWSPVADWRDRTHLYVHQRPLAVSEGSRVWLCKDRRFFHHYRIDGFLELSGALPEAADGAEEHGWALVVSDGKRVNRDIDRIPDPHGVVKRWMQGFRYLAPDAKEFVKAPRRPRMPATARSEEAPVETPAAAEESQGSLIKAGWAGRLARRLGRR